MLAAGFRLTLMHSLQVNSNVIRIQRQFSPHFTRTNPYLPVCRNTCHAFLSTLVFPIFPVYGVRLKIRILGGTVDGP